MKAPFFAVLLFLGVAIFCGPVSWAQDSYFGSQSSGAGSKSAVVVPSVPPTSAATLPIDVPVQDIKVVTAVWGSEHKFVEVTNRIADVFSHPAAEYEIGPEWLHADPAPNWKKVLVTVYEVHGVRYVMANHEGIILTLRKIQENLRGQMAAKIQ